MVLVKSDHAKYVKRPVPQPATSANDQDDTINDEIRYRSPTSTPDLSSEPSPRPVIKQEKQADVGPRGRKPLSEKVVMIEIDGEADTRDTGDTASKNTRVTGTGPINKKRKVVEPVPEEEEDELLSRPKRRPKLTQKALESNAKKAGVAHHPVSDSEEFS